MLCYAFLELYLVQKYWVLGVFNLYNASFFIFQTPVNQCLFRLMLN